MCVAYNGLINSYKVDRRTDLWCDKPAQIFFAGTGRSISTKLGMKHWGLLPILHCSNDDPGVTLTYLTTRSNLVI